MKLNNLSRLTTLLLALMMMSQCVVLADTVTDYDAWLDDAQATNKAYCTLDENCTYAWIAINEYSIEERYNYLIQFQDHLLEDGSTALHMIMTHFGLAHIDEAPDALCTCFFEHSDENDNGILYPYGDENHLSAEDGVDFDEDGVADTCPWHGTQVDVTLEDTTTGITVTGDIPAGVTLTVEAVAEPSIETLVTMIDPSKYAEEPNVLAYNITLMNADGTPWQPAANNTTVTVNVPGAYSTVPETPLAEAVHMTGGTTFEVLAATVNADGSVSFEATGFSTYYVVAGSQSDGSGDDTFYILRGTSVQLTNVNNDNYTVTYPDSATTAEECNVSITRNDNTLTFAATANTTLGTYTIRISTNRTATIHVLSPEDMFELPEDTNNDFYNNVYFTVLSNSTEIPNEPMSGGDYSWNYITKNGTNYSFSTSFFMAPYQNSPTGFLKIDVIAKSDALEQNLQGQNAIGVIDNGWGENTRPCVELTDAEWHNILTQFVSGNPTVYISNGAGGRTQLTSTMVNEKLEDGSYRYKMYPYVIKLVLESSEYQKGWHVDCAIVDTKTYSVSYEYNLPSSAVIQENSDLLKPETKFYTPGTTGVEVGVMTLGNSEVTGNTSVTIYDTNTLSTSEYKFLYWNTAPDGSGTSYNPDAELPAINSNVTLYAIWNHTQTSGTVKITKTEVFVDPNDERKDDGARYTFTVAFANAEAGKAYPYTIYNADNTIKPQNLELVSGDTISLLGGEYAIVNNVPGGAVTITEYVADGSEFDVSWNVGSISTEGNTVTATVTAGNQTEIVCINTYAPTTGSLTITKAGSDVAATDSFIFTVKGVADTATADIDMQVVITGTGSVTINDLPLGSYTVAEDLDWAWRYTLKEVKVDGASHTSMPEKITLDADGTTVGVVNDKNNDQWLSDEDSIVNFNTDEQKGGQT